MSTHNICFLGEIRKILSWYPPIIWWCDVVYSISRWHITDNLIRKPTFRHVCPAKIQISLHIFTVGAESYLHSGSVLIAKYARFFHGGQQRLIRLPDEQADLSLHLACVFEGMFSHTEAHCLIFSQKMDLTFHLKFLQWKHKKNSSKVF